jgi:hypothetical protein
VKETDKYVVAFRTHRWDEAIQKNFDNLRKYVDTTRWQVVVLADETNGALETPEDVTKISHTSDLARFGLLDIPSGRSLWRNGDYAIHPLKEAIKAPGYIILENDSLVQGDKLFQHITEHFDAGGDFVTAKYWPTGRFHKVPLNQSALNLYPEGTRYALAYVWLWGARAEAVTDLLQARLDLVQVSNGTDKQWPIDELFLGTYFRNKGIQPYVINDDPEVDTSMLEYRPPVSTLDETIYSGNRLVHPVVKQEDIFTKYLDEDVFLTYGSMLSNDYFNSVDEGGRLRKVMMLQKQLGETQDLYNRMIKRVIFSDTFDSKEKFASFCSGNGFTYPGQLNFENIALFKPIQLSSTFAQNNTSAFTYGRAATDGNLDLDKYRMGGFGTRPETKPWAILDLESLYSLDKIVIYHREIGFERTQNMDVSVSQDGENYTVVKAFRNIEWVESASTRNKQGKTFTIEIDDLKVDARFIKFELKVDKPTYFHLNQIEVFGREVPKSERVIRLVEGIATKGQLGQNPWAPNLLVDSEMTTPEYKVRQEQVVNQVIGQLRGRRNSMLRRFYQHLEQTDFAFSSMKENLIFQKNKLNFIHKTHNDVSIAIPDFSAETNWQAFQDELFDFMKELEQWTQGKELRALLHNLVDAEYNQSDLEIPYQFAIECLYERHIPEDCYCSPVLKTFFPEINVQVLSEDGHQDIEAFKILFWMYKNSERMSRKIKEVIRRNQGIRQSPKLFSFWDSGLTDAPKIVQNLKIINEDRAQRHGLVYVFLDSKSINDYLELPVSVQKYRDNDKISPTFYSEWVRFALINRYGGMWLDSTIYLTENGARHVKDEFRNFAKPRFVSWQLNPSGYLSSMSAYSFVSNRNLITTYVQAGLELLMEDFETFPAYYTVDNLYTNLHAVFTEVREITLHEEWNGKFDLNYQPNLVTLAPIDGKRKTFELMWSAAWVLKFTYKNNEKLTEDTFGRAVLNYLEQEVASLKQSNRKTGMLHRKKILLTSYSFKNFGGAALNTVELADQLQEMGAEITFFSYHKPGPLSKYIEARFNTQIINERLNYDARDFDSKGQEQFFDITEYDYIWVAGSVIPISILRQLRKVSRIPKFIFIHMSRYVGYPLDSPMMPRLESAIASRVLSISESVTNTIDRISSTQRLPLMYWRNPARGDFAELPARQGVVEKIAVISSSHPGHEIMALNNHLPKQGISIDYIGGYANNHREVTAELLSQYDLVIGIGRDVTACLSAGIPIYIYGGRNGGPGYLNESNYDEARRIHFDGGFGRKNTDEIATEIVNGYQEALKFQTERRDDFIEEYSLPAITEKLFTTLETEGEKSVAISEEEINFAISQQLLICRYLQEARW